MKTRVRIISSDFVDFGVTRFESDFINNIISDIDDHNSVYISVPFESSQVLKFIQNIQTQRREDDSSSESVRRLLGIKEQPQPLSQNEDFDVSQMSENNLDETQYFIKVEIDSNSSFTSRKDMEEAGDNNIVTSNRNEDDVTFDETNITIEEIYHINDEENADSVIQVANNDITVEAVEQTDTYEEHIPQCSFLELDDEVLNEDMNVLDMVQKPLIDNEVIESPLNDVEEIEQPSNGTFKVKVTVVASGVSLMKDIRRRKRKRGC